MQTTTADRTHDWAILTALADAAAIATAGNGYWPNGKRR